MATMKREGAGDTDMSSDSLSVARRSVSDVDEMALDEPVRGWGRGVGTRAAAVAILLLASFPLAVTALVVWCTLDRPLLFKQSRAGLNMRTFTIQKFRTMHDSRDLSGELLPDPMRETAATRLLRRMRLDELPQLLAILRGDMAFVGPRPLLPATVQEFGKLGRLRCSVRPGLTGWAQVSGNTLLTDSQKLALDIWYIDHRSWALDLRILLLTVSMIIRGERIVPARLAMAETHLAARGRSDSTMVLR